MTIPRLLTGVLNIAIVFSFAVSAAATDIDLASGSTMLSPTKNFQYELQAALINAIPGDTIELRPGRYELTTELNIVCDNFTLRGAGPEETVLSFKGQLAGSSGIVSTGNAFVIEDMAVEDTAGNAIKTLGAQDVTFRNVRVEWTDGPKSTNGAYGIYPVECRNVLIENCVSIGASDAGIYVGQSEDVIVKGCLARQNVAGIEIENTIRADVFDNTAIDNAGGILVFDLPGLNVTNGGQVRVFRNKIDANNHPNFAPKGTMVADVPAGSGIMVMATDHVEIFDNDITNNQTSNIVLVSYLITERKLNDKDYDPWSEAISIHHNRMANGGGKPSGQIGMLLAPILGGNFPDIFFDGLVDSNKLKNGTLPPELQFSITNNGEATFANVNIGDFSPANVFSGKYKIDRDLTPFKAELKALPSVKLKPHASPTGNSNPAVAVYRKAPKLLSEWNLFVDENGQWNPAADVLPYELNTPLFSDYTNKHRFVRLPNGAAMKWHETDALEFPVGTVIAKTFAYPDEAQDKTVGERFLETRIELHESTGWYGYSYVWNEDQTDASLQLGGGAIDVTWTDKNGSVQSNKYQVPNANQCLSCHAQHDKYVPLGPTARNLNRKSGNDPHNQLNQWIQDGFLADAPVATEFPKLVDYTSAKEADVNHRARAWLEVNCAHCHNPGGSARTSGLDLRTSQLIPAKFGVMKSPVAAGKGSGGRRYDIVPGKPDESILLYRLETEETGARMPNLARNMAHSESNQLIREWIKSMSDGNKDSGE